MGLTFNKSERLNSKILIDKLFGGGNMAMSVFPLRAIYMLEERAADDDVAVQLLISVPKRKLHHAVDRNRMKRQIREAYRLHKQELWDAALSSGKKVLLAFVCIDEQPCSTEKVSRSVVKILNRLTDKLGMNG